MLKWVEHEKKFITSGLDCTENTPKNIGLKELFYLGYVHRLKHETQRKQLDQK